MLPQGPHPEIEVEMDEQDHRKGLSDKHRDTQSVSSDEPTPEGTGDTGSVPNDGTVRSRIVVREGRRREALKKRPPSST
ncbi:hypothetical protein A6U86_15500 [Rhizobium sp. AC27/96]|nr:hypothetical protein A6U86_15500 [Rhizobium sp. AC27/96]